MFDFIKKKIADVTGKSSGPESVTKLNFKVSPQKAAGFVKHAKPLAEAQNYEYAVQLYSNALKFDPTDLSIHQALHDMGLKYKITGGKPPSMADKFKSMGKDQIERLSYAEFLWAKDPLDPTAGVHAMECAVEAWKVMPDDVDLRPAVIWIGKLVLELSPKDKKYRGVFGKVCDLFAAIREWEPAVEALTIQRQLTGPNDELLQKWKELEAERTIEKGKYAGNFKESVRDMDKQKALEADDQLQRTDAQQDDMIGRRRKEYQENPTDLDRLTKLVTALLQKEEESFEDEALVLLDNAYKSTNQYRYKMQCGDVHMRRLRRKIAATKAEYEARSDDAELKAKLSEQRAELLNFEVQEFSERVKNYPTDMRQRYDLALRLMQQKKYDDAISYFQDAQSDPRNRARAHYYLAVCYEAKEWYTEAVETLAKGIAAHPIPDDQLGLDLRYLAMKCQFGIATRGKDVVAAREAQRMCSQILQSNIGYKDIRDWNTKIKAYIETLPKPD